VCDIMVGVGLLLTFATSMIHYIIFAAYIHMHANRVSSVYFPPCLQACLSYINMSKIFFVLYVVIIDDRQIKNKWLRLILFLNYTDQSEMSNRIWTVEIVYCMYLCEGVTPSNSDLWVRVVSTITRFWIIEIVSNLIGLIYRNSFNHINMD
jgi:hypothetical protein